jgi:hypothetical protein
MYIEQQQKKEKEIGTKLDVNALFSLLLIMFFLCICFTFLCTNNETFDVGWQHIKRSNIGPKK